MDRISTRLFSAMAFLLVALVSVTSAAMLTVAGPVNSNDMPELVQLERVVIEGHSASAANTVEQLPRVVIVGRRASDVQLASACTDTSVC